MIAVIAFFAKSVRTAAKISSSRGAWAAHIRETRGAHRRKYAVTCSGVGGVNELSDLAVNFLQFSLYWWVKRVEH